MPPGTKLRRPGIKCPKIKSRRTPLTTKDCVNLGLRRPQEARDWGTGGKAQMWIRYNHLKYQTD